MLYRSLVFSFVACLTSALCAQPLAYSTWAMFLPGGGQPVAYFQFGVDTVNASPDNLNYEPLAEYWVAGSTVRFVDVGGSTCLASDTGVYVYSIDMDTLRFELISDPCTGRAQSLVMAFGVQLNVGLAEVDAGASIVVFPNPSVDGTVQVRMRNNEGAFSELRLYAPDGRLLEQRALPLHGPVDQRVDLGDRSAGIYLLSFEGPTGRHLVSVYSAGK